MADQEIAHATEKAARYRAEGHWRDDSLWSDFQASVASFSTKRAIACGGRTMTFDELDRAAAGLAGELAARSVKQGDVVAIFGRNSLEAAVSMLACIRIGAVMAPMPLMFGAQQLGALLDQCTATALICIGDRQLEKGVEAHSADCAWALVPCDQERIEKFLTEPPSTFPPTPLDPDAPSLLLHSSGTTSTPKAIVHSSNTMRYAGEQVRERWQLTSEDVYLVVCEFGFVGSLLFGYVPAMLSGALMVMPERWNPADALRLVEEYRVTFLLTMPTHTADILSETQAEDYDTSSIRVLAAFALTPIRRREVEERFGTPPISDYGLSEVPGNCTHGLGEPTDKTMKTEGWPYQGTEVRIVDQDGNQLGPETEGSIEVDGPSRFLYFMGNPELTESLIAPWGGYRTGDRGYLDADEHLVFLGRSKDTIERGGVQILPAEVEPVLLEHSSLREVSVIPYPDERLGERVCAALILVDDAKAPTVEELQSFLEEKGVAKYIWPEMVEVFEDFPRTSSLKPIKKEITAAAVARHSTVTSAAP
jgi:acyl-coenzyme A synthetase/AMP-(fatty) acid ligase